MRSLSATARQAVYAAETGEVFVILLTLSHTALPAPIRVCSDNVITSSGGNDFVPFPFMVQMPDEGDQPPGRVILKIDNVDRQIVTAMRTITGEPMTCSVSVVLASTPSVIEAGPFDFTVREIGYDAASVEASIQYEDVLNDASPAAIYDPTNFRGLH